MPRKRLFWAGTFSLGHALGLAIALLFAVPTTDVTGDYLMADLQSEFAAAADIENAPSRRVPQYVQ